MSSESSTSTIGGKALLIGIAGLLVALFGLWQGVENGDSRPVYSWLIGFSYWLSICIGFLFLTMIFYVFDAGWPIIIRRQLENGMAGFYWLGLIFLPLLAIVWGWGGDSGLFWTWMNPDNPTLHGTIKDDSLYILKSAYLNKEGFTVRAFLYFLTWGGLAYIMRKSSYTMDTDGDVKWAHLPRKASTVGLFACAFATTFAAIDWFMTLEYHWFSTIYGVWFFAESMRSSLAMIIIIIYYLSTHGCLQGIVKQVHYYLIACLMLAFTMFWTYVSFSQYFLIYSANIPEETFWYQLRELSLNGERSTWWAVSMFLVFGQFVIPFLMLLFYKTKVIPKIILGLAFWMLFTHVIDIYWNILPGRIIDSEAEFGYTLREFRVTIYDVAMLIGVGGIMVWSFLRESARHKAIPIRDPRILESINAME